MSKIFPEYILKVKRTASRATEVPHRLDRNERHIEFSDKEFHSLLESLKETDFRHYPDSSPVYERLSELYQVQPDQILLSHGSDVGIHNIIQACVSYDDKVVGSEPGYGMYECYVDLEGGEFVSVELNPKTWQINISALISAIDEKTKLVLIENPNGFVGTTESKDVIDKIYKSLPNRCLMVIDQAYGEYVGDPFTDFDAYPRIVVTRTFSKYYGLAGIRVGSIVGAKEVMSEIRKVRPIFEISNISIKTILWCLNNLDMHERTRDITRKRMEEWYNELTKLGITVRKTKANFILVKLSMREELLQHGIRVRRPFTQPWLSEWTRVAVGTENDLKIFMQAFKSLKGNNNKSYNKKI